MQKNAVFPGSFDPFTIGHESIVRRALPMFDNIIIAIGINSEKKSFFPLEKRISWLKKIFEKESNVIIDTYHGLTIDFCKKNNAKFILRGLRTTVDFEFEYAIAQMNKQMYPEIETVFLLSIPEYSGINSTIVREVVRLGGDATMFVPKEIDLK
jgi:pantetheine-phosphate adenylyltransferase